MFTKGSQTGFRTILFIALAISLMILDKSFPAVQKVRNAISVSLTPLLYIVSAPIHLIDDIEKNINTHDKLVRENLNLNAQLLLLQAQMQRLVAIEAENNQLKALMHSSSNIKGKVEVAQLLAVDTEPFVHQVILNKGSKDHVYVGQPVLDASGLMGQIIQVSPLTSRVLLTNDPRCGVPVQNARNALRAIAQGDTYTGKIKLVNVPQTLDIKAGDTFVTSGLGVNYPEGYPVGKVLTVAKDPGLPFATIILEPAAQLDRSRQVLLIWPKLEGSHV